MRAPVLLSILALPFVPSMARAAEPPLGAAFVDTPLSDGSVSIFGAIGFPGVEAGYRQGVSGFEFGAVAGFDYTRTALTIDAPVHVTLLHRGPLKVAAGGYLGLFGDFGAQYYIDTNWPSAGLRLGADAELSYRVGESIAVLGMAEVPGEICLTERGDHVLEILLGGGVELGLGDGYTFGARGAIGPMLDFPRGGSGADTRVGAEVLVALGKRIF